MSRRTPGEELKKDIMEAINDHEVVGALGSMSSVIAGVRRKGKLKPSSTMGDIRKAVKEYFA